MQRREFVERSAGVAACSMACAAAFPGHAFAADARPRAHARVLLTDAQGRPLRAGNLRPLVNYLFHYPFEATPVFLLNLGRAVPPQKLATQGQDGYLWPGGVGKGHSVVAYSAICAHQLVYPTPQVSFISFRKGKAARGVRDQLIHCCAEHSQYDPAAGAKVLAGPAERPLCAVLLEHNPRDDSLTAHATLGAELFEAFFAKYEAKLSLDMGPRARNPVQANAAVRELDQFCKNNIQC